MTSKYSRTVIIMISLLILGCASFGLFWIYQSSKIDDSSLRKYLKNYPEAVIFKPEYLDFFTPEDPMEKQRSIEYKRTYVIRGDFNKNGKKEIAVSGLLSKKADRNDNYYGFVLVLEKSSNGYKKMFFQKFLKEPKSLIKNLFLFCDPAITNGISIGFANDSGLISTISWKKDKYVFEWNSESW